MSNAAYEMRVLTKNDTTGEVGNTHHSGVACACILSLLAT
jgi:hypothetical protein